MLISATHTKKAWEKALQDKVADPVARQQLSTSLYILLSLAAPTGEALVTTSAEKLKEAVETELQRIYAEHEEQSDFLEYFKKEWEPKKGELIDVVWPTSPRGRRNKYTAPK